MNKPNLSLSGATINNSNGGLSNGPISAATSLTNFSDQNEETQVSGHATRKLDSAPEATVILDVEKSIQTNGERPVLIELPYSLRTRKLKIATIVTVVSLDGFILPTILFYILKYGVHLDDGKSIAITTAAFGFISLLQYVLRLYRLLKPKSPYLPLNCPHRWYLDLYQIQFTIGFIAITLVFTFLSTSPSGEVQVRNISLAPCMLLLQCGPQFLLSCYAYKRKWINHFRFSSSLAGEQCVPAAFTMIEDVIGVDGRGGGAGGFRETLKGRYMQSFRFREMLYKQTLFWGIGSTMGGAVTLALVLAPVVNQYVAYGIGWSLPFVWSGVMAVITTLMVQKDLKLEKEEWETANVSVLQGYQLKSRG
ncbi:hypothetical protein BDZ91DRAFT_715618 [Kalaharituber pfeilii]|nr:hypothetical protein BDZ91DRAFT_715618 [Kalaharituber pfeilii]